MKIELTQDITSISYSIGDTLSFKLTKDYGNNGWTLSSGMFYGQFKLMNGKTAGGSFPSFEKATEELLRIRDYYDADLNPKDVRAWFDEKFLRREEEGDLFRVLKRSLIKRDWKTAAKTYNKLSNYSKEAVPNLVTYQIQKNL